MTRRLLCAVGVVLVLSVSAQSPDAQVAALRQVAAQCLPIAVAVDRGELVRPSAVINAVRQAFEANPKNAGTTLADDWSVVPVAKALGVPTTPPTK